MLDVLLEKFDFIEPNNTTLKIIIGQSPYKQKLGSIPLKVSVNRTVNPVYNNFSEVAFLVNDWIKVQDSLEMIFNLFCRPNISLKMISYLKSNNISPIQFADFLFERYKIVLVNHFDSNENSQQSIILNLINRYPSCDVYVLFVGEKTSFQLPQSRNIMKARALHPSGKVLNTNTSGYYDTWYNLNNSALKNISPNFTLDIFRIIN
ncbi:hypothetical protein GI482_07100 [Bacillus sp. N3536]|nr:hypothetical protein GI482_07100 [Bacillus sp. N3536]